MSILTDELIEKGAAALYQSPLDCPISWEQLPGNVRDIWRIDARACLTAALPEIIEACALVAGGHDHGALNYRWAAARDVRGLLPPQEKEIG